MTTVGVEQRQYVRQLPMQIPQYSYSYPTLRHVQLAAVKEGIFHPRLPTLRRMDMDSNGHKLPDEHSRTTTTCGPEDFKRATSTLFAPPAQHLSSAHMTATGRNLHRYYTTPEELKDSRTEWAKFLDRAPERYTIKLPDLPNDRNISFSGYAVRYLKPEVTGSWKYSLRQEPQIDQFGQRPLPANIFARYRDTVPQYSRNITTEAWR